MLLIACSHSAEQAASKSLPPKRHKDSLITFTITPPDTINPYTLLLSLRNNTKYPYSNLFLITHLEYPHGKTITDTLEYRMAAPNGQWLGKGLGQLKDNLLAYKDQFVFKETGVYVLKITHALRNNGEAEGVTELEGITDIGYQLNTSNLNQQ